MTQYLITVLSILCLSSCVDSTRTKEIKVKPKSLDAKLVPDSFINRNDTASFNIDKGMLIGKTQTLDISYGAISCTCAQWSEAKYSKQPDNRHSFFLEPANSSLIDPDTLFDGDIFPIRLSVTGQFYLKEGYPKNYHPAKGRPKPARVFRYTKIKIISVGSAVSHIPHKTLKYKTAPKSSSY